MRINSIQTFNIYEFNPKESIPKHKTNYSSIGQDTVSFCGANSNIKVEEVTIPKGSEKIFEILKKQNSIFKKILIALKIKSELPTDRFVAIGDIHGQIDLLKKTIQIIPQHTPLIFIGDYCDRGTGSKEVIDFLSDLSKKRKCIFLQGNHGHMMLKGLQGEKSFFIDWLGNGGEQTLQSYDKDNADNIMLSVKVLTSPKVRLISDKVKNEAMKTLNSGVEKMESDENWQNFFLTNNCKRQYFTKNCVLSHASSNPNATPDIASETSYLWERERHNTNNERITVHGHSPSDNLFDGNDIDIDKGFGKIVALSIRGGKKPEIFEYITYDNQEPSITKYVDK